MKSSSSQTNYYLSKVLAEPDFLESNLNLDESKGKITLSGQAYDTNRDGNVKLFIKDLKSKFLSLKESIKEIKETTVDGLIKQKENFKKIQKEIEITQKPSGTLSKDIAQTNKFLQKSKTVLEEADKTLSNYQDKISILNDGPITEGKFILTNLITYLHFGGKKFIDSHEKLKSLKDNFSKTQTDKPKEVGLDTSWLSTGNLEDEKNRKIGIIIVSTIAALIISLGVSANILGTDFLWESITDIFIFIIAAAIGAAMCLGGGWVTVIGFVMVLGSLFGIYEALVKAPFLIAMILICVLIPAAGAVWIGSSEDNLDSKWSEKQNEAARLNESNETQWQNEVITKTNEFRNFFNQFKSEIINSSSSEADLSNVKKDDLESIEKIITDWNNEIDELHAFEIETLEIFNSLKPYRSKNQKSDKVLDNLQTAWAQHS